MSFGDETGYYFLCESCDRETLETFSPDIYLYFLKLKKPTSERKRFNCSFCGHQMEIGLKRIEQLRKKEPEYKFVGFGYKSYKWDGSLR
jgi:hypothetical protein